MMKNSETAIASIDNATATSIGTPCLICGDTVSIASCYVGPKICDKCKEAVLHVRQQLERDPLEPILDTAVSDTCPCNDCEVGWGSLSSEGYKGCEDTCKKFAKWRAE